MIRFHAECRLVEKKWDEAGIVRHTSGEEGAFLAGVVERVWANRVPGVVLECGACSGFSTVCLSIACAELGYPLVSADSWQGLPDMGPHPEYVPGQFKAGFWEWAENVKRFGRTSAVTPLVGWFEDTLPAWARVPGRAVALLWMDVDLGTSVKTVLREILPVLSPGGLIVTHETESRYLDADGQIIPEEENEVWREIRHALAGRPYRARLVCGSTGEVELL